MPWPQASSRRWTLARGLALLGPALAGCQNPLDSFAECNVYQSEVAEAGTVQHVDPVASVQPLLGTSDGTITWTATSTTSPLHVTLSRSSEPTEAQWVDCSGPADLQSISVPVRVHVASDDGRLDASGTSLLELDASGRLTSTQITASAPKDDAGVSVDVVYLDLVGDGGTRFARGYVETLTNTATSEVASEIATIAFTL